MNVLEGKSQRVRKTMTSVDPAGRANGIQTHRAVGVAPPTPPTRTPGAVIKVVSDVVDRHPKKDPASHFCINKHCDCE